MGIDDVRATAGNGIPDCCNGIGILFTSFLQMKSQGNGEDKQSTGATKRTILQNKPCNKRSVTVERNYALNFASFIVVSDVGIVVSIAAFQAVDPGSIPGHRNVEQTLQKHFGDYLYYLCVTVHN